MIRESGYSLLMLVAVWDELAASHSGQPFERRFFADVERLKNFQKTFPEECPSSEIEALERKIIHAIRAEFSRDEVHRLRARLNRFN